MCSNKFKKQKRNLFCNNDSNLFQIWIALFFVFFEVDTKKDVENTKPRGKFWNKLQSESTSLVKTMKDRTIPKGDNTNITVKDLNTKDDDSKLHGIDSKNAAVKSDVNVLF